MPAMRSQASAIYIGVITVVASIGPVLVSYVVYIQYSQPRLSQPVYVLLFFIAEQNGPRMRLTVSFVMHTCSTLQLKLFCYVQKYINITNHV